MGVAKEAAREEAAEVGVVSAEETGEDKEGAKGAATVEGLKGEG